MKPAIFRKKILKFFIAATGIICWLGIILIPIQFFTGFLLDLFGLEWTKFIAFFIIFCFIAHIILTSVTEHEHWFEWITQLATIHEKLILKIFIPIAGIVFYSGIILLPICYSLFLLEALPFDLIPFIFVATIFSLIVHMVSSYQLGVKNWFEQGILIRISRFLTINERSILSTLTLIAGTVAYLGIILLLISFFINFSIKIPRQWFGLLLITTFLSLFTHIFSSYHLGIKNWFGQDYYEALYAWIFLSGTDYEKRIRKVIIPLTGILAWIGIITLIILYFTELLEVLGGWNFPIFFSIFVLFATNLGLSYQAGVRNWFGLDLSSDNWTKLSIDAEPYQKKSPIKFFRYVYYRILLTFGKKKDLSTFQFVKYLLFLIPIFLLLPISFFTVYLLNLGTAITTILMTLAYVLMFVIYMKTNTEGMEKEILEEFATYKNNLMNFLFYGYLVVIISIYGIFFYLLTKPEFRAIIEALA